MASHGETSKTTTTAAAALLRQFADNDDDMSWVGELPAVQESAPGDELYDTIEDFVADQSDGEESTARPVEEGEVVEEEDDNNNNNTTTTAAAAAITTTTTTTSAAGATQASGHPPTAPPARITRKRWTGEQEIVLYLLHQHYGFEIHFRAQVFNRVFRHEGHVREGHALEQRWYHKKASWRNDFANLTPAQQNEHQRLRGEIDAAVASF